MALLPGYYQARPKRSNHYLRPFPPSPSPPSPANPAFLHQHEQDAIKRLGKDMPNLSVATLIGGVPVVENAKTLEGGCHIAVGTPGRVKFLIDKGLLLPETARTLVLESADWLIAPVFLVCVCFSCVGLIWLSWVGLYFTPVGFVLFFGGGGWLVGWLALWWCCFCFGWVRLDWDGLVGLDEVGFGCWIGMGWFFFFRCC